MLSVSNFSFVYALSMHFLSSSSVKSERNLLSTKYALSLYDFDAKFLISSKLTEGKLSGTKSPPSALSPVFIASAELTDMLLSLVL